MIESVSYPITKKQYNEVTEEKKEEENVNKRNKIFEENKRNTKTGIILSPVRGW